MRHSFARPMQERMVDELMAGHVGLNERRGDDYGAG